MIRSNTLQTFFLFSLLSLASISCNSDDDSPSDSSYPKEVSITYKVSSPSTNSAFLIEYKNETGGNTNVSNPTLPYTKTITKIANQYDVLSLGYGTNETQTVKLEIAVNNETVKSQEFTATSGAIVFMFE